MEQLKVPKKVLDEEDDLVAGIVLLSYQCWASIDLIPGLVLASYLALWLKRYVVFSAPSEHLKKNLYPVVLLASRRSLGLLPTMVYMIHRGLRAFCQHFIGGHKASPRVKISYACLMACFATHCERLMTCGADANKKLFPTLCQFEDRQW